MCRGDLIPAKTLCRVFAFLNLFLGLLALYYWELMSSFTDKITYASRWDSVMLINENTRKTISEKCGEDYLSKISPRQFGTLFNRSIQFYIAACIIFSIKGFAQFFVTCFNPVTARAISVAIITLDILTTCVLLYGLYLFRSPELCLLEHTEVFYYPGRQSQMTIVTLAALALIKPAELISILCFICDQNKLISAGETRSKGVRRSDAFRTPMVSPANSFLCGDIGGCGWDLKKSIKKKGKVQEKIVIAFQQLNSDDEDDDDQEDNGQEVAEYFLGGGGRFNHKDFVEIDLNDNENNNGTAGGGENNNGPADDNEDGTSTTITILHIHNNSNNSGNNNRSKNDGNCQQQSVNSNNSTRRSDDDENDSFENK